MEKNYKNIILLVIGLVFVASAAYFINNNERNDFISVAGLPAYNGQPVEKIGKDPFIKQIPRDYLEKYKKELTELNTSLINNPNDAEKWLRVGVIKKFFNNYTGARDAWEYAKVVRPRLSTTYYNLGDLYGDYLKDLTKAEENYLQAIEIDPTLAYLYLGLADFYSVFYKIKSDQAREVILRGLKISPDDEALLKALEVYTKQDRDR